MFPFRWVCCEFLAGAFGVSGYCYGFVFAPGLLLRVPGGFGL